jgi:hypothetical protein
MADEIIFKTVGEKSQALYDAIKAKEKCQILVPYPIGWIFNVPVSQISISLTSLDNVEIKRTSISECLSFEVKKEDD